MLKPFARQRLGEVVRLWNEALPQDKVNCERLRPLLQDPNFDPELFLLDIEGGVLHGFALGMHRKVPYYERGLEPETGWLLAFGVAQGHRRAGVGTALLSELEARLRRRGARRLVVGAYSPLYFMPGLDEAAYPGAGRLLEKRGYRGTASHIAMQRTLFDYTVPKPYREKRAAAEALGYRFQPFAKAQGDELLAFLERHFTPGWRHNAAEMIASRTCAERTWLCLGPGGEIVGFAQRGMGDISCRFGPFGIHPGHRNRSLGGILLCCMLYDMSCRGLYIAHFMSTDENGARMYARHGFKVYRTFTDRALPMKG